jgi:hypothetical protein
MKEKRDILWSRGLGKKRGLKCSPLRTPDLTLLYFWGYVKQAVGTVTSMTDTTRVHSGVHTDEKRAALTLNFTQQ